MNPTRTRTNLAAAAGLTLCCCGVASAGAETWRISGSGIVMEGPVPLTVFADVCGESDGNVSGRVRCEVDASGVGGPAFNFLYEVSCLHISGDKAWIGGEVVFTSDPANAPLGLFVITTIEERDGMADIMHFESEEVPCADEPAQPQTALVSGDFNFANCVDGDVNADESVDFQDIIELLGDWGACPPDGICPADLNGDGMVTFADLLIILGNWS